MMKEPLRVIVSNPHLRGERAPTYDCHLGAEFLCQSHQPIFDCARLLLERGYDREILLTTRHADKAYDSFMAEPIEKLAKLTVLERASGEFRIGRYQPRPEMDSDTTITGGRSRNPASPGTGDQPEDSRILGRDAAA